MFDSVLNTLLDAYFNMVTKYYIPELTDIQIKKSKAGT